MPFYRRHGKIESPLTDQEFLDGMTRGKFVQPKHKAFVALVYYTGIRKGEALRATREQFRLHRKRIIFSVGKRLKHGIETPALIIPLKAPYAQEIWDAVQNTGEGARVFPYSSKTAYNIFDRVFYYPHHARLSRITNFFLDGYTIPEVKSWTGLTLKALDYYVGLVNIEKMSVSLGKPKKR